MPITRLIYFSENQLDPGQGSVVRQLSDILAASKRNNETLGITGALVFDDRWFLQTLEGERTPVWQTLKRIEDDERHSNIVIVEACDVSSRLFANWWMGIAVRNKNTEAAFAPFLVNGLLHPEQMAAADILDLMVALAKQGLSRSFANAA